MIEISAMHKEDSGQVYSLFGKCFDRPWSLQGIEAMFEHRGYYNLIARDGSRIVGYIGILAALNEADITNVAVDPEYRRQHLAARLLDRLLAAAKEEGISTIYLEVRRSNTAARRLYENAGFMPVDIRKNYYEHPAEDAVIMKYQHFPELF